MTAKSSFSPTLWYHYVTTLQQARERFSKPDACQEDTKEVASGDVARTILTGAPFLNPFASKYHPVDDPFPGMAIEKFSGNKFRVTGTIICDGKSPPRVSCGGKAIWEGSIQAGPQSVDVTFEATSIASERFKEATKNFQKGLVKTLPSMVQAGEAMKEISKAFISGDDLIDSMRYATEAAGFPGPRQHPHCRCTTGGKDD